MKKGKLLLLKNDEDVRMNRLASLEKDLEEDATMLLEVLVVLINFCKEFDPEAYRFLNKVEDKLEEANLWAEIWAKEIDTDSDK